MLRLGISSWAFPHRMRQQVAARGIAAATEGLLSAAGALGVGVVQIADNLPIWELSESESERLFGRARKLGLEVELGARASTGDELEPALAQAERAGVALLRLVLAGGASLDEAAASRFVASLVPRLERASLTLAIENHERFPAEALRRIVESADSASVGVCLDTANSLGLLEGLREVVECLAPWVVNLHVKDVVSTRIPSMLGFRIDGAPAGSGRVDIAWAVRRLAREGRTIGAVLEQWPPELPDLAETLATEARWAEESLAWMRTLREPI